MHARNEELLHSVCDTIFLLLPRVHTALATTASERFLGLLCSQSDSRRMAPSPLSISVKLEDPFPMVWCLKSCNLSTCIPVCEYSHRFYNNPTLETINLLMKKSGHKLWYSPTMKHYLAIERNQLTYLRTWINLENIWDKEASLRWFYLKSTKDNLIHSDRKCAWLQRAGWGANGETGAPRTCSTPPLWGWLHGCMCTRTLKVVLFITCNLLQ